MRVVLVLLAAGLSFSVSHVQAQVSITGKVVDSASGKPVSGAEIFLFRDPSGQKSGKDGRFTVTTRGAQDTALIVRRDGYVPVRASVAGTGAAPDLGTLYLRPIKNDGDEMAADDFDLGIQPVLAEFYRRKHEIRQAIFFTGEQIARSGGRTVTEVLRKHSQLRSACIRPSSGGFGCGAPESKRGTTYSSFRSGETSSGCLLENYVNGRRIEGSFDDLEVAGVLAIEVYNTAPITPLEFKQKCGAIVVWTDGSRR